jgi:hypothetical protein
VNESRQLGHGLPGELGRDGGSVKLDRPLVDVEIRFTLILP